jgi:hypothetical protein
MKVKDRCRWYNIPLTQLGIFRVLLSLAGFYIYKTRAGQAKVFCRTIQESTLSLIPVTEGFHTDDVSPLP